MNLSIGTLILLAIVPLAFAVDRQELGNRHLTVKRRRNRRLKGRRDENGRRLKGHQGRRRAQVPYLYIGNEDFPPGFLGVCDGDCDSDLDCAPGLECFHRDRGGKGKGKGGSKGSKGRDEFPVPGCSGTPERYVDYCYDPFAPPPNGGGGFAFFEYVTNNPSPLSLGLCEGDCDDDLDCEGLLFCYQRVKDEVPPALAGCSGTPQDLVDYCAP